MSMTGNKLIEVHACMLDDVNSRFFILKLLSWMERHNSGAAHLCRMCG
jgi:hypothetical protein